MPQTATPQSDPAMTSTQQAPASTQADPAAPAQDATATTAQQPATSADATTGAPVNSASQVAQVVESEFPTYDKDSSGTLNKGEFTAWMVALKSASDPTMKADSAATKTWVGKAFATADVDKSKSVSKTELEGFLAQGA